MRSILFILSFLMLSFSSLVAQEDNTEGITVTGEGIVKVKPDRVKIRVRVEHEGDSAQAVKKDTDQSVDKVLNFLENEEIPEKDYKTDYINLDKKYDHNTKETHYTAQQAISITLNDVDRYNSIMSGLMKSGINRIDGISFEDSKVEKHQMEAREKAVVNAQEKAKTYAKPLGLKVKRAKAINELPNNTPQPRPMLMRAANSVAFEDAQNAQDEKTLAVGQIEIKEQVEVRFSLE